MYLSTVIANANAKPTAPPCSLEPGNSADRLYGLSTASAYQAPDVERRLIIYFRFTAHTGSGAHLLRSLSTKERGNDPFVDSRWRPLRRRRFPQKTPLVRLAQVDRKLGQLLLRLQTRRLASVLLEARWDLPPKADPLAFLNDPYDLPDSQNIMKNLMD